ncbi:MAG: gas vesicle protein [Longimicrobiales bacterium]
MSDLPQRRAPTADEELERITLAEVVNRVLDRGVLLQGEVVISVAGVDLVYLGLELVLSSAERVAQQRRLPPDGR